MEFVVSYTQRLIAMRAKILEEGVEGWRLQDTPTSKEWVFQTPLETVIAHRQTRETVDLPAPRWIYRLYNTPLNKAPLGFVRCLHNPLSDLATALSPHQRLQYRRLRHTIQLQAWSLGARSSVLFREVSHISCAQGEIKMPWTPAQLLQAQKILEQNILYDKGADMPFKPVLYETLTLPNTQHDVLRLHTLEIEPLWAIV